MNIQCDAGSTGRLVLAGLAHLVLSLTTGRPLNSVEELVPQTEDDGRPIIGI